MTKLTEFQRKTAELLPGVELRMDESLARHTSFRIGGPAEVMAFPKSGKELAHILKICPLLEVKPVILGAGTNVLAPDAGTSGLVICLKDCLDGMERLDNTHIQVMAGVTMTRAAMYVAGLGLSGLEFAHGIPGTVGGGIYMNAGAYGGEICQVVDSVDVMDSLGNVRTFSAREMDFSYRHSRLEGEFGIVIRAVFRLMPKPVEEIRACMRELKQKRYASQPLDLPSAGSVFKRPAQGYAAALIEGAGLKGYQVGGAAISEKHAGFAVNLGGATAEDVKNLLGQVSDLVYEKTGTRLEPEVRIW
ncbi:MAG: UDP-N-acetylmuramate dehydrogenase [Faecousia sp.]